MLSTVVPKNKERTNEKKNNEVNMTIAHKMAQPFVLM